MNTDETTLFIQRLRRQQGSGSNACRRAANMIETLTARAEKAETRLKGVVRSRDIATEEWIKAARKALAGDLRDLSSRVELSEMAPDIVQSAALKE